jgi:hypothetical protein
MLSVFHPQGGLEVEPMIQVSLTGILGSSAVSHQRHLEGNLSLQ